MSLERERPSQNLVQPTYILTPSDLPGYGPQDEFRLSDYFRILWRRRTLIVLGTLACGITAFTLSQFLTKRFEARATLLVQRPTFTSELATRPLSVETYEALVNSGYVITSLRERLIADAKIDEKDSMGSLKTEIFASKLLQQPYSPIIDLVVQAPSAEKAQMVANAWADVFISVNYGLSVQGKEDTVEFIEAQYPLADLALKEEEAHLLTRQDEYSRRLLALETAWTDRILDYSAETRLFRARKENEIARQTADFHTATQRMVEEHEKETERLVHEFRREWRPGLLRQELSVIESKRGAFQSQLLDAEVEIDASRDTLKNLRSALREQPQYLVVSQAISDEALWTQLGTNTAGSAPRRLNELKLRSERINPLYERLLSQLITLQVRFETLLPQRTHLSAELNRVRSQIEDLRDRISETDMVLFDLQQRRAASLEELKRKRSLELGILSRSLTFDFQSELSERNVNLQLMERQREKAIGELTRSRDIELTQLSRNRNSSKTTFSTLAAKYEAAQLAKAEQESDVRIGAYASLPQEPIRPRPLLNTALALVVGFMMTIFVAFGWEFVAAGGLNEPA